jgi:hypothetical protein
VLGYKSGLELGLEVLVGLVALDDVLPEGQLFHASLQLIYDDQGAGALRLNMSWSRSWASTVIMAWGPTRA